MLPRDLLKGLTVVVVDDEPDSLEVVKLLVEMHGAKVIGVTNGREGVETIRQHRPDFVISDLTMPEMTGWEMIDILKHDSRPLAEIPVIALTAHAMDRDRRRAIEMGFHNFISKPLQPENFIQQVLRFLVERHPQFAEFV